MTATHRMITGLQLLHYVILVFMIFTSTSISHQLESRFADAKPVYESFHDTVYARRYDKSEARNVTIFVPPELRKRGPFLLDPTISAGDMSYLRQAFIDMLELVTFVAANPNRQVLQRYFDLNDENEVTAIFNTVRRMAEPGGFPRPAGSEFIRPYDISEITILRTHGSLPNLAFANNVEAQYRPSTNPQFPDPDRTPTITVTSFGWGALWKRRRNDLKCGVDIGPKTNYKMHYLGSLLLHEILYVVRDLSIRSKALMRSQIDVLIILPNRHFNNVPTLAWERYAPNEHPLLLQQWLIEVTGCFWKASYLTTSQVGSLA